MEAGKEEYFSPKKSSPEVVNPDRWGRLVSDFKICKWFRSQNDFLNTRQVRIPPALSTDKDRTMIVVKADFSGNLTEDKFYQFREFYYKFSSFCIPDDLPVMGIDKFCLAYPTTRIEGYPVIVATTIQDNLVRLKNLGYNKKQRPYVFYSDNYTYPEDVAISLRKIWIMSYFAYMLETSVISSFFQVGIKKEEEVILLDLDNQQLNCAAYYPYLSNSIFFGTKSNCNFLIKSLFGRGITGVYPMSHRCRYIIPTYSSNESTDLVILQVLDLLLAGKVKSIRLLTNDKRLVANASSLREKYALSESGVCYIETSWPKNRKDTLFKMFNYDEKKAHESHNLITGNDDSKQPNVYAVTAILEFLNYSYGVGYSFVPEQIVQEQRAYPQSGSDTDDDDEIHSESYPSGCPSTLEVNVQVLTDHDEMTVDPISILSNNNSNQVVMTSSIDPTDDIVEEKIVYHPT